MSRELTLAQRIFARVMDAVSIRFMGHPLPFLREILRTHGFAGFRTISGTMQRVQQQCIERYGPIEANVLISAAAMWNGCKFCPRSHLWTANLYHFRDTGKLFPLDDAMAADLQKLTDGEALTHIKQRLTEGGFAKLAERIDRQYHLKAGDAQGTTEDDPHLLATIAAWDWMAECTVYVEEDQVFPADPIGRDADLMKRYQQARGRPLPSSSSSKPQA